MKHEAHPVGVDDHHLADLLVKDLGPGALEAELHVLRDEGIAVVELQTLAEFELVGRLVRAHRPGLRETWRKVVAGHGLDEGVVQCVGSGFEGLSRVPEMMEEVQVQGTFPDGMKLVTIHHPIR